MSPRVPVLLEKAKDYNQIDVLATDFDCSGLVYAAYRASGVGLPRTIYGMLGSRRLVAERKSRARRGGLAFFGSGHVELYDRGNWTFGAADAGSRIGFHRMNSYWQLTMYFR